MRLPSIFAALVTWVGVSTIVAVGGPGGSDQPPPGWMGVVLGLNGERVDGIALGGVVRGSPAEKAGLRARDRILVIDGAPVASRSELAEHVRNVSPGGWIALSVDRNGKERTVRVRLAERPETPSARRLRQGSVGIRSIELPTELREHFGAPDDAGVMISHIESGSPAEAAGFELADVVFDLEGTPIRRGSQLSGLVRSGGIGNTLEFKLMRRGVEIVLEAVVAETAASRDSEREEDPP